MRRWMAIIVALAMTLCCAAQAESVTGALGIAGGSDSSVRGDLSARTPNDLFVVMNDASNKALVRLPRAGGTAVKVESAQGISNLVAVGEILYFLRTTPMGTTLVRRNTDGTRTDVYTFADGTEPTVLSAYAGNLYVLIDNQLHIIYPATGQSLMLLATRSSDYVIVGDYLYYISLSDMLTYESESLMGNGTLKGEAGCLYRMNLNSGTSSLVIKTGMEDLRYLDGSLYFHNLADNYVMGDETSEWLEGRIYRYELSTEQLTRLTGSYDWGFYPLEEGVAVYTSQKLDFYNNLGGLERTLYNPELYAVLSGGDDLLVIYEPTGDKLTYVLPDGTTADAYEGEPGYTTASITPITADPTPAGEEGDADDLENADTQWYDDNQPSANGGSGSGASSSSSSSSSGGGSSSSGGGFDWSGGGSTEKDS